MEITGHITRRRALAAAAALIAVLALGGKLLLGGGAGTGAGAARAAGTPAGAAAPAAGASAESTVGGARTSAGDQFGSVTAAGASAPARPSIVVHVVGAVRRPGLYTLPDGSRAADAVTRAGGATAAADLEAIDLAAPIVDGQQVAVPRLGGVAAPGAGPAAALPGRSGPAAPAGPVHLNTATVEQLDALPGIGPSTAQKIVDYRSQHGAFRSVDELDAIPGFGPAKVEQLRKLVAL